MILQGLRVLAELTSSGNHQEFPLNKILCSCARVVCCAEPNFWEQVRGASLPPGDPWGEG